MAPQHPRDLSWSRLHEYSRILESIQHCIRVPLTRLSRSYASFIRSRWMPAAGSA